MAGNAVRKLHAQEQVHVSSSNSPAGGKPGIPRLSAAREKML
jgi:hypothetical protein